MRLIDADDSRKEFMERVYDILSDEPDNIKANLIIDAFDEMKVAYDVDKVVEQLENKENEAILKAPYPSDFRNAEYQKWMMKSYGYKEAIEIVKAGGVNE